VTSSTTLKPSDKPTLLFLTSSFPSSPDDETCGYVRDFARSLAIEFNVIVLAPPDRNAAAWPSDAFRLTRSRSVLPSNRDPFQAGDDLNDLFCKGPLSKLVALVSLSCFFAHAIALALRADLICSNWMVPSGLVGALISRAFGKRHVVVEHSGALHLLTRMRGGRRIARFIVAGSDRIVTVSDDLKRKLVKLCSEAATKVEVISMGIDLPSSRETFTAESILPSFIHPTVLFIGRLTEIKGLWVLLKAMEGIDGLQLIVAGDGASRDEHQRMARQLSLNASFLGRVGATEREQLLSGCDAVVIPSTVLADGRSEGTPVVCLEAMAAGRVVIASRVGGLAEVIIDGENGLLFEQGDHRILREKLMLALSDDSLRLRISENAQHAVAAYEWKRIGLRFADVLRDPLRKNDAIGNRRIESGRIH
jgi:glycosyltransferase involved in cell wall biosynthesis